MLFPPFVLSILIFGSLFATAMGAIILIFLLGRDFLNKDIW